MEMKKSSNQKCLTGILLVPSPLATLLGNKKEKQKQENK